MWKCEKIKCYFLSQCVCCDESIRQDVLLRRRKNKAQADPSIGDLMISGGSNSCSLCAQDI